MGLTLVATPIGNLGDLSQRAETALRDADFWLVEDTRVSGKLQAHLGLSKPMRILNEHTSPRQVETYLEQLQTGKNAALLTDGGTPVISDPGALLIDLSHESQVEVDSIPGPSAVTNSLALSGFYAQRFAFLGFLARKPGPIKEELSAFADSPLTLVFFESPHRLCKLLQLAHEVLGERRYAVCREMTKMHQQVWRARLPVLPSETEVLPKGEISLVIEGKRKSKTAD